MCDEELKRLKTKRGKRKRKMRKTNLDSDIRTYREACAEYCLRLKDTKRNYYAGLILDCAGDSKKLFQVVNSLCKVKGSNLLPPYNSAPQLANDFGDYFVPKVRLTREKIKNCTVLPHDCFVPSPSGHPQRFSPVTEQEIRAIISSSSNASWLLDPVPTWLVKLYVNGLAPIITNMINSSLENGCVPDGWKIALIARLLKKTGLELVYENFRPVSNLPIVSKLAEQLSHSC